MKLAANRIRILAAAIAVAMLFHNHGRAQSESVAIDAAARAEAIEGALKALNESYVFPDVARRMEQAIRERAARKEYDGLTNAGDFARALSDHLQAVSRDKHLRVVPAAGSRFGAPPHQQGLLAAKRNYGFEKVERMSGNIGYLDLRGFEASTEAQATATAAMNFLAHTDALIVDLRQNGGGSPHMIAFLSSYLFDKRTHLNDIYNRPNNSTQEFWTRESVPGKHYGNKPVYVLTSNYTFSAAEEFTYNLKNLKRATIVGATTGGGAHPVQPRPLGRLFIITVPFARSINPITKTNWEGTGVKPDIETAPDKALKVAHLAALKAVQPATTDAQLAAQLKALIEGLQREVGEVAAPLSAQAPPASQPPLAQEAKLPDTPAGRTLGKFLAAFNTGKLDAMKQFHRESGGDEGNADQDMGFYQQSGGLTLHSLLKSSDHEITVLVQTKNGGNWMSFQIGVERSAPHPITDIRIQQSQAPGEKTAEQSAAPKPRSGKPSEAELGRELNALLDKAVAADSFSGVVMLARGDRPVYQRAVGLADKTKNEPNRVDTKFNLGSINKVFTQVAIQQLVEAGKLSLDDKLGRYLPDYPNTDAREKVTIRHLVNMQSGIGDFFGPKFQATPKHKIRAINDYLPLFASEPLKFEPGTSRAYSNGGYLVLGAIIEKVTGRSYYDYVREHIYKPAGMSNTDSYESDAAVPNLARGYTRRGDQAGQLTDNVNTRPGRGSSAGGGYSTADDLLKFSAAIRGNKLLSAENSRKFMGLGAAGGAPGINAVFDLEAEGYTIIVLSNYDPPSAEDLSQKIRELVGQ
jgi:CubicO group peptidase (beta-lactamase class C family)